MEKDRGGGVDRDRTATKVAGSSVYYIFHVKPATLSIDDYNYRYYKVCETFLRGTIYHRYLVVRRL